jgi:hypothetical protein
LAGTGVAGMYGRLPAWKPRPYILRFDEAKPNPLYRRVCYTFAWNAVLSFALLKLSGLAIAAATGSWYMKQIYPFVSDAQDFGHTNARLGSDSLLRTARSEAAAFRNGVRRMTG